MGEFSDVRGLIFMCGRNCAPYVGDAIKSLAEQVSQRFDVLFIDDASSDGTAGIAQQYFDQYLAGRYEIISCEDRKGKARHAYEQLSSRSKYTFVAVLDADDRLQDSHIIQDLISAYDEGFDVVWTNYETDGGLAGNNGALDPWVSPRSQGWKTSHFFSFRQLLFRNIPEFYFRDELGEWFQCACDFAIAFPVLDQTRRYLYMPRRSYRYTSSNPHSHHNQDGGVGLSSPQQQAAARQVLNKPPLPVARDVHSHVGSVLQGLVQRVGVVQDGLFRCEKSIRSVERALQDLPYKNYAIQQLISQEGVPMDWLSQTGGWALDLGLLSHLTGILNQYENPRVLEFGSGLGSKTLAKLVQNRGGSLICVEHDLQWHQQTAKEFEVHGLSTHARVEHCPLIPVEVFGHAGRFYDMPFLPHVAPFDVVIVDGPPARTNALARLPALPMMAAHLSPDRFHVLLDDYEREEEQAIVKIWRQVVPELRLTELKFGKGVAQLTP